MFPAIFREYPSFLWNIPPSGSQFLGREKSSRRPAKWLLRTRSTNRIRLFAEGNGDFLSCDTPVRHREWKMVPYRRIWQLIARFFIQEADLAHWTRSMPSNLSFLILRMNEPVNEFRVRNGVLFLFAGCLHDAATVCLCLCVCVQGSLEKSMCRSIDATFVRDVLFAPLLSPLYLFHFLLIRRQTRQRIKNGHRTSSSFVRWN